jgi:DNA-directed RNA polymerase specialized sigma24 family protein
MPSASNRFRARVHRVITPKQSRDFAGLSWTPGKWGSIIIAYLRHYPLRLGRPAMSFAQSDGQIFLGVKAGNSDAFRQIYERYYTQLVRIARATLRCVHRSDLTDPAGVADSALATLAVGLREGRFQELKNLDHLWALLIAITKNKAHHLARYLKRLKQPPLVNGHAPEAVDPEPPPEVLVALVDNLQYHLELLDDDSLQKVANDKLLDCTDAEIAERLNCSVATVQRKWKEVRHIWHLKGMTP